MHEATQLLTSYHRLRLSQPQNLLQPLLRRLWYNAYMRTIDMPPAVRACLWSYDVDKIDLDLADHRQRLVENILRRGTMAAIDWLLLNFNNEEIAHIIKHSRNSAWDKKSLALWSLVFKVRPSYT